MSDGKQELKRAKSDYGWATAILGTLLSASSVISLIQNGLNFDLHWGFEHFVAFYRGIVGPIMDVLLWPIQALSNAFGWAWTIPQALKDVWTLSFVGASIQMRSHATTTPEDLQGGFVKGTLTPILFIAIFGVLGLGLFTFLFVLSPNWNVRATNTTEDQTANFKTGIRARQLIGLTALAVIIFYIGNAVAPQLAQ